MTKKHKCEDIAQGIRERYAPIKILALVKISEDLVKKLDAGIISEDEFMERSARMIALITLLDLSYNN